MKTNNIKVMESIQLVIDTLPMIMSLILFFACINLAIYSFTIFYFPASDLFDQIYMGIKFILSAIFVGSVVFCLKGEIDNYTLFEKVKIGRSFYLKLLALVPFALLFFIFRYYSLVPFGILISIQLVFAPYYISVRKMNLKDAWNRSVETFKSISLKNKIFIFSILLLSYIIYKLLSFVYYIILGSDFYSIFYYLKLLIYYILYFSILSIPVSIIYTDKMLGDR